MTEQLEQLNWNALIHRLETADPELRCYLTEGRALDADGKQRVSMTVWRGFKGCILEMAGRVDTALFAALTGFVEYIEGLQQKPLPSTEKRCPFCDRSACRRWGWALEYAKGFPGYSASTIYEWSRGNRDDLDDCIEHRHAWRPEALNLRAWKEQALARVALALTRLDRAIGAFHESSRADTSAFFTAAGDVAADLRAVTRLAAQPPPAVLELRLCEAHQLALRPDVLYRFTVAPGCEACAAANAPYTASTSAPRVELPPMTLEERGVVEAARAWASNAKLDAPWIRSDAERALVGAVRALAPQPLTRYVRCDRQQIPTGAKACAWGTPAAADAAKALHDASLNERGWAIETLLHPLSAEARDDADNLQAYPHAVVDVESIADPATRVAFLIACASRGARDSRRG